MHSVRILVLGLLIISLGSCTSWMTAIQPSCPTPELPTKPRIDIYEYDDYYCFTQDDFIHLMDYIQSLEAEIE